MKLLKLIRNLFSVSKEDKNYKVKSYKTKVLIVNVGTYIDDGVGSNDYWINFKVKKGKVHKRCIRAMKKGENTHMFNTLKLTPVTDSAFVRVKKIYPPRSGGYTEIYNINLIKHIKKWRKVEIY